MAILNTLKRASCTPVLAILSALVAACAADPNEDGVSVAADDGLSSERAALVVPPSGVGSPGYTTSWWRVAASGAYDSVEQKIIPIEEQHRIDAAPAVGLEALAKVGHGAAQQRSCES